LRKGLDDPRGSLMIQFISMLHKVKPTMFMIENVKGLLTHDSGKTIEYIIQEINKGDLYNVTYKLLNAYDYGVPQKRERVFIVGILKEHQITFQYPEQVQQRKVLRDVLKDVPQSKCSQYTEEKKKTLYIDPTRWLLDQLTNRFTTAIFGKKLLLWWR
jgi:DNA (cytosine-5)-methyltransferase 1